MFCKRFYWFILCCSLLGTLSCQSISSYKTNRNPSSASVATATPPENYKFTDPQTQEPIQPKKRLVVFDFWNHTPFFDASLGHFVSEGLKIELAATHQILLATDLEKNYATQDFVDGEEIKVVQLIREARKMGFSLLVLGRVKTITFHQKDDQAGLFRKKHSLATAELEAKLFDVNSGREILSSVQSGEAIYKNLMALGLRDTSSEEFKNEMIHLALREATQALVPEILRAVDKTTWEGKIVKLLGAEIIVNAGRASGILVGDILKVLTSGEDIYDEETSTYLGRSKGRLKGTLEVTGFVGVDAAVTKLHTGGNILEGDTVQLY